MINFGKTNSWHFHFNFINSLGLKPFPIREGRGDKMLKNMWKDREQQRRGRKGGRRQIKDKDSKVKDSI